MPRKTELPEGTDHIINGAMETGTAGDTFDSDTGGAAATGFVGSAAIDDTGGTSGGGTAMTQSGRTEGGKEEGAGVVDQLRTQARSCRGQAGNRFRESPRRPRRGDDTLEELSQS